MAKKKGLLNTVGSALGGLDIESAVKDTLGNMDVGSAICVIFGQ